MFITDPTSYLGTHHPRPLEETALLGMTRTEAIQNCRSSKHCSCEQMDTSKCNLCSWDKKWKERCTVRRGLLPCPQCYRFSDTWGKNAALINLRTKADLNQPLNLACSPPGTQFRVLSCWGFIHESLPEGTGKKGWEDPRPTAVGIQGKPEARSGNQMIHWWNVIPLLSSWESCGH